jgi:membrane fusion protein (multidrug efflux system)
MVSTPMQDASEVEQHPTQAVKPRWSPLKRALVIGAAVVVALGAFIYWYRGTFYEDTDDAQIDGNISSISSRVAGTVIAVHVQDNQLVAPGQTLVELDPTDLQVARDQARAALAQAEAQLLAERTGVSVTELSNQTLVATSSSEVAAGQAGVAEAKQAVAQASAQLKQAEASDQVAQLEKQRSDALFQVNAISRAEHDRDVGAADASAARVQALREAMLAARRRVDEQAARANAASSRLSEAKTSAPDVLESKRALVALRQAAVDAARAALQQAELNLGYAVVKAPVRGIAGKRGVNVGDRVSPGQALLGITQIDQLWVTANFRETQVRHMQRGQTVSVHVDALGSDFEGKVESLAGATGSRYSLLPPENASGNYVKVVQRLPVRIALSPRQAGFERLRPGMSVEPEVRVK